MTFALILCRSFVILSTLFNDAIRPIIKIKLHFTIPSLIIAYKISAYILPCKIVTKILRQFFAELRP